MGNDKCFIKFFEGGILKKNLGDPYVDHSYTDSFKFFLNKFKVNHQKQKFLMSFLIEDKNLQN